MNFFNNGKYSIHYDLIPEAFSENILFIHGNLSSNTWWKPTIQNWEKQNSGAGALIFAEWRGCGKTDGPETLNDLAVEQMAQDYIDLLEHLKIKNTNLVGHSTGGVIALKALTLRPDLFLKVTLLDPVVPWGFQAPPELMAAFLQMKESRDLCAVVMGSTIHENDATSPLFTQIVDDAFGVHPMIWQGIPEVLSHVNFKSDIPKIKNPVQVLHGEFDQILSKKDSEELAKLLPQGSFTELKGQGHSCNIENPQLLIKHLKNFFN